jgi:hypothetical protein
MLRTAYFEDFKDGPKVLLWGNRRDMQSLANLLRASSVGTGPLGLDSISNAVDGKPIVIETMTPARGLQPRGYGFEWSLNPETMNVFAELVDKLAESDQPGHQYLECGADGEVMVMVSRNEYPNDLSPVA